MDIQSLFVLLENVKDDKKSICNIIDNEYIDIENPFENNKTALNWAAYNGYSLLVEILIIANVDINKQDDNGKTALISAAENGCKQIMQSNRSWVECPIASLRAIRPKPYIDYMTIIELLIKSGADASIKDNEGHNTIYYMSGWPAIV